MQDPCAVGASQTPEELLRRLDAAGVDHWTVFSWVQCSKDDFIVEYGLLMIMASTILLATWFS